LGGTEILMNTSTEVSTDPNLERRSKRRFTAGDKLRLLQECDALPHGDKGAWLRRNGLYAGQMSVWRKQLEQGGTAGLQPGRPGRKAADPREREIQRLEAALKRAERRAYIAEQCLDLQKKMLQLVAQQQSETSP